jgi:hypothetical protein
VAFKLRDDCDGQLSRSIDLSGPMGSFQDRVAVLTAALAEAGFISLDTTSAVEGPSDPE